MNRRNFAALICTTTLISGCANTSRVDWDATLTTPPTASSDSARSTHPTSTQELDGVDLTTVDQGAVDLTAVDLDAVDDTDPDDVARAVVATLNAYDTRTDTSPAAAVRRAAPLLTPALATELSAADNRTDSTWLDLEQHDGYTTATVDFADEYGQPATTSTTAYVQVSMVLTLTGRDSWVGVQAPQLVRVTLIRHTRVTGDRTWLVDGFPT